MSWYYEIYAFSDLRDEKTLDTFFQKYSNREKVENNEFLIQTWSGEEIEIVVDSLTDLIDFAKTNPFYHFRNYIEPHKEGITHLILSFTEDSGIIFGICIDEKNERTFNNYTQCLEIENNLKSQFKYTYISTNYPPAKNLNEFKDDIVKWQNLSEDIEYIRKQ